MKNVEALQALYTALGGEPADVANATTSVEVLNAIAAMFEGESDAVLNPEAIENIAAVADNIGGGGSDFNSIIAMAASANSSGVVFSYYLTLSKPVDENGTYRVHSHGTPGDKTYSRFTLVEPATKINVSYSNIPSATIVFTPNENFDGFYYNNNNITPSGDTITPGDGKTYIAAVAFGSGPIATTVTITKTANTFEFEMEV